MDWAVRLGGVDELYKWLALPLKLYE